MSTKHSVSSATPHGVSHDGVVSLISRFLVEHYKLYVAAVESHHGATGLFSPSTFYSGESERNAAWQRMWSEINAYQPPARAAEQEAWRPLEVQVDSLVRNATPEELASQEGQKKLSDQIRKVAKARFSEPGLVMQSLDRMQPYQVRSLCEDASTKLLTVGKYQDYLREEAENGRQPLEVMQRLRNALPVTNGFYRPRGIVTTISVLANRVPGSGRPQPPAKKINADRSVQYLGALIDWLDKRQAELDREQGLLGTRGTSRNPVMLQPEVKLAPAPGQPAGGQRADGGESEQAAVPEPKRADKPGNLGELKPPAKAAPAQALAAADGEPAQGERLENQQLRIAPENRTKPMSYREAARHMGKPAGTGKQAAKDAAEWLKKCIDDGIIVCESVTRQNHVFDKNDFPQKAWKSIMPPDGQVNESGPKWP